MRVQLPDGKIAEFPDNMAPEQIESVLADQYSQAGSTSTITGETIPTGEEKISQSNEAIRKIGPVIGDVAMTAAAPQVGGAGMGIKAINLLMRAAAAGAGGGVGDIAAQKITSDAPVDIQSAGKQAAMGAAGEVGGTALMGATKMAGKYLGKPALNLASDLTSFGKKVSAKATKSLKATQKAVEEKTTQRAVDFIDGMKAGPEKETAGLQINDILSDKKDFGEVYKEYNKLIDMASDSNGEVLLDDFAQEIGDLVQDEMVKRGNHNWAQALREVKDRLSLDKKSANIINDLFAQSEKISTKDAKYLIAKLKSNYKTDSDGLITLKDKLQKTALGDIGRQSQTGEAAIIAREKATEIYKTTQQWFRDNPLATNITNRNWSGGYVLDRIFKGSPEEAARIKSEVIKAPGGKEAWAGAEFSFIKDLFEKNIKKASDTGKQRLLPDALSDDIYANENLIKTVMPDSWPKLKAEADFYRESAPQFANIDANDMYGVMSAWEIISPKSKKLVGKLVGFAEKATKIGIKSVAHMAADDGTTK